MKPAPTGITRGDLPTTAPASSRNETPAAVGTPPRMYQPVREELYIDSEDEGDDKSIENSGGDETPRGAKRSRSEGSRPPEPHGEPEFKRLRTEAPGPQAHAPAAQAGLAPMPADFPAPPAVVAGSSFSSSSSTMPSCASAPVAPRPDWRTTVTRSLSTDELNSLGSHQVPRALFLLYGADLANCPAEQFFLQATPELNPDLQSMLVDCGALVLGTNDDYESLVLYTDGFLHRQFGDRLLALQRNAIDEGDHAGQAAALVLASLWGNESTLCLLLSHGADTNLRDRDGKTALMHAAEQGNTEIVRLLCEHPGSDLDLVDEHDQGALAHAAGNGHADICVLLLEAGATVSDEASAHPLLIAARRADTALCEALLEHGLRTRIDDRDYEGNTAIMLAAAAGSLACCRLLAEAGANLFIKNDGDHTLLARAAESGQLALFDYLLELGAPMPPGESASRLEVAARRNHIDIVRRLLELEHGDHEPAGHGIALMEACNGNAFDTAELLLKRGADPNVADWSGKTPLMCAAQFGSVKLVQLLLRHGASLHSDTHPGFHAMGLALRAGSYEIVKLLLGAGAPCWTPVRSRIPVRPLMLTLLTAPSQQLAWLETLDALLKKGAPIHQPDQSGNDPLMLAVAYVNPTAITALLGQGAQIGQTNVHHLNALGIAVESLDRTLTKHAEDMAAGDADTPLRLDASMVAFSTALLSRAVNAQRNGQELRWHAITSAVHPLTRELVAAGQDVAENFRIVAAGSANPPFSPDYLLDVVAYWASGRNPSGSKRYPEDLLSMRALPQVVIDFLLRACAMLPSLMPLLYGAARIDRNSKINLAIAAGLCATLGMRERSGTLDFPLYPRLLPFALSRNGMKTEIDMTESLSLVAKRRIDELVAFGDQSEENIIAPVFATLFDLCAASAWPSGTRQIVGAEFTPQPGAIAKKLVASGIYAVLANPIEAAWAAAWSAVSAAGAPEGATGMDALLQRFRAELRARTDAVKAPLLNPGNLPVEAAALYADLLHRQLYMLSQFVRGESDAAGQSSPPVSV